MMSSSSSTMRTRQGSVGSSVVKPAMALSNAASCPSCRCASAGMETRGDAARRSGALPAVRTPFASEEHSRLSGVSWVREQVQLRFGFRAFRMCWTGATAFADVDAACSSVGKYSCRRMLLCAKFCSPTGSSRCLSAILVGVR